MRVVLLSLIVLAQLSPSVPVPPSPVPGEITGAEWLLLTPNERIRYTAGLLDGLRLAWYLPRGKQSYLIACFHKADLEESRAVITAAVISQPWLGDHPVNETAYPALVSRCIDSYSDSQGFTPSE